jgi:hypothetical protein
MPNHNVPAAAIGLPTQPKTHAIIPGSPCVNTPGLTREPIWQQQMITPEKAPLSAEPSFVTPNSEGGFAITDAGRMFLLISAIIHIEGETATFQITPAIADALAEFGADSEDMEEDDPPEEDDPLEDNHDREADCWFKEPTDVRTVERID